MSSKDWVLFLIPTFLSLASFIIAFMSFQKDKAQLKISADYSVGLYEMPTISVTVNNVGKRPTTIIEAGFRPDHIVIAELMPEAGAGGSPIRAISDLRILSEPFLIDSGAAKKFTLKLSEWPSPFIHADTQLLAYAKDVSGKYYYGKNVLSKPILRHILDSKGQIPIVPQNLIDPSNYKHEPLSLKDLYPSQKLLRMKIAFIAFLKAQK